MSSGSNVIEKIRNEKSGFVVDEKTTTSNVNISVT